jgi:phosphoribosylanthranilate isomerase
LYIVTHIKICGITNVADALCAAKAGAHLLGFIFYPKSPRYIVPDAAAEIVYRLQAAFGECAPRCVGVFVNEPVAHVRAVLAHAHLDLAQLHGDEPLDQVRQLGDRAYKAIRPETLMQARAQATVYAGAASSDNGVPQLLVDAYHPQRFGGTGLPVDLVIARGLTRHFRLLLAGGLMAETVGAVVEQVRPWGVDVSSGVEREKGIKDHSRVNAFIEAVRAVDVLNSRCRDDVLDLAQQMRSR